MISLVFFAVTDLSGTSLFPVYWHAVYVCLVTPIYFFVAGSFSKDIASDYFNRIFGEYKGNFAYQAVFADYSYIVAAMVDCVLIVLLYVQCGSMPSETPLNKENKSYMDFETLTMFSMLTVNAVIVVRMRMRLCISSLEIISLNLITTILLLFLLEPGDMTGIVGITSCPQLIL